MLLVLFFVFVMGLVWGSFLNVVIYRVSHGTSPLSGRSVCPKCNKQIPWKYNIPILSFLLLKGKCANCHKKISWQYPIVELLTALLFVWWYWVGMGFFNLAGQPWSLIQPLFWLIVGMLLLVVFFSDLMYGIISDNTNLILGTVALLYRLGLTTTGQMRTIDLWLSLGSGLALTLFFVFLWLVTKRKGFGEGDIKLAPALGILLGWPRMAVMVFVAFVLGGMVALLLLFFKKKRFGQTLPFGPFLVIGTAVSLLWGWQLWGWYVGMLQ